METNIHSISDFVKKYKEAYDKLLFFIKDTVETEDWSDDSGDEVANLEYYIDKTFVRCFNQNKIVYSSDEDQCCINLGLRHKLTGEDIILLFKRLPTKSFDNYVNDTCQWTVKCALTRSDWQFINDFDSVPERATYYDESPLEYGFDPTLPMEINKLHLLDNWERIKGETPFSKNVIRIMLLGALEETKNAVIHNPRLAVPQYYGGQLGWFLPIVFPIDDDKKKTLALGVTKTEKGGYRVNTILTKRMAISNARIVMPIQNMWLIQD